MHILFRPPRLIFFIAVIFVGTLFPLPAHGQGGNNQNERRQVPPLDLIILVDESETMWNKTDTEGIRVNTVEFLIDLLSSEQSGAKHRVAIIAFGTEPKIIPFTLLDSPEAAETLKEQFAANHKHIQAVKNLQYTDINQALQAALNLLKLQGDSARKSGLVLISDGQPTNPQVSEKKGKDKVLAYLDETRSLLGQLTEHPYLGNICPSPAGAPLYMVGMGVDRLAESSTPEFIEQYREFWQETSGTSRGYYQEAEQLQDMQGISTYIFSELLCIPATPSLGVRADQTLEYQVYDSYYQIFFTISGKENPDLSAKVYRPNEDGTTSETPLNTDAEGVTWQSGPDYEVWGIRYNEPWTGTWRVSLEGDGRAEFSYVFFPKVTLELDEPNSGFLPVDRPFNIQAKVTDENGQVVDIPLKNFRVEIEGQDLREQLDMEKDGDVFVVQHDPLQETGEYSLTFSAQLPDGTPIFEHKFVTLVSAPWVDVTAPSRRDSFVPNEAVPVEAGVHAAGGATSFDDIKLIATLIQNGEPIQTIEMSQGDTLTQGDEDIVMYSGNFQPLESDGEYSVQTKLRAILPGGRVFDYETAPLPFSVITPPTATPSPLPSPTSSPTPTPSPTPTATLTPTPEPVAVVVPTSTPSPTPLPTPTPTPMPWYASMTGGSSTLPCLLGLLLLLLILAAIFVFWYRRRRKPVPDKITLLANLIRSRKESGAPPYILLLGSGAAVSLGNSSTRKIIETIANGPNMETFHTTLDNFSPVERQIILEKHFEESKPSSGHRYLAELIRNGYFDIIFTTNIDPFLENCLDTGGEETADFQIIITDTQRTTETIELLDSTFPPIKIVKLHGDVQARSFAFTPSEISQFGSKSEELLRHYLKRDLIVIGPGQRDYDLNRAMAREGGSIWYIDQGPPPPDTSVSQAVGNRSTEMNIIIGEFGMFDRFFEALRQELMP